METMNKYNGKQARLGEQTYTAIKVENKLFLVNLGNKEVYKAMGIIPENSKNQELNVAKVNNEETYKKVINYARIEQINKNRHKLIKDEFYGNETVESLTAVNIENILEVEDMGPRW